MSRACWFTLVIAAVVASLGVAQDKKDVPADKKKAAPIAPAEKVADGWEEIDERLVFLMVRLANTETSLEAVEKAIAGTSSKQSVKTGDAKRAIDKNEKMDQRGGGPMKWNQFYGTTAEKFFYHPTDRNSSYHTVTILTPQPPQNDNKTAEGTPSRQGLPVHQRPPQFDYIYKAARDAAARADAEVAQLKNKVDALTARRQSLELEQVALWVEIAFRMAAHFDLDQKPMFRFEPKLVANDADAKQNADTMKAAASFMRVALSIIEEANKDQSSTLLRIKPTVKQARQSLNDSWLRLAVDTSDKKSTEGKFAALAKRLDDVSSNLSESYEVATEGDQQKDQLRKETFRGQLQQSLVSYAQIVLALDEMCEEMKSEWKIKPDIDRPYVTVSLASVAPTTSIKQTTASPEKIDSFQADSVWTDGTRKLEVLSRSGEKFRASFQSTGFERIVSGSVSNGKFNWLGKDVKAVRGGAGDDNWGVISSDASGDKIDLSWKGMNGKTGTITLRRVEP